MTFLLNGLFHRVVLLLIITILSACGGGGGDIPEAPPADMDAPFVVSTIPSSEQTGVNPSFFIRVQFNEAITKIDIDQVFIQRFVNNKLIINDNVKLKDSDPYVFDQSTNILTIKPISNALVSNTKYQITIQNIQDTSGNIMSTTCKWVFATVNYGPITTGKTAVCGQNAITAPNQPLEVIAIPGDASITVSWKTALDGAGATHFIVEKSVDGLDFTTVNAMVPSETLTITDDTAENGKSHVYRVTAVNDIGRGKSTLSKAVTPQKIIIVPGPPQKIRVTPGTNLITLNWQAPVTGNQVVSYRVEKSIGTAAFVDSFGVIPNTQFSITDKTALPSQSIRYQVIAVNSAGSGAPARSAAVSAKPPAVTGAPRISNIVAGNNSVTLTWLAPNSVEQPLSYTIDKSIDNQVTFLPVATNLAVNNLTFTDTKAQNGIKHIYRIVAVNAVGKSLPALSNAVTPVVDPAAVVIKPSQTLQSTTPLLDNLFGSFIAFSSDGKTMAVGEPHATQLAFTNAGSVRLYSKVGSNWILGPLLVSTSINQNFYFGNSIAFSPDNSTLAIGEGFSGKSVQLFFKNGTDWTSNIPIRGTVIPNIKASYLAFSPDNITLAVGDGGNNSYGDGTTGGGKVRLYLRSGNSWNNAPILAQTLAPTIANSNNAFGFPIAFNSDGTTLAVGEYYGDSATTLDIGKVNLFILTTNAIPWLTGPVLTAVVPANRNRFGAALAFSPDDTTLAVGQHKGDDPVGLTDNGTVELFIKNSNSWSNPPVRGPIIIPIANSTNENSTFGYSITFNTNSTVLAVGALLGKTTIGFGQGHVRLYSRSGIDWSVTPTTGALLVAPGRSNNFSNFIAFSPDGSTFVVAEHKGDTTTPAVKMAGLVHVFETSLFP